MELKDFPDFKRKIIVSNVSERVADDEVLTYFRSILSYLSKPPDPSRLSNIDEEDEQKRKALLESARKSPIQSFEVLKNPKEKNSKIFVIEFAF